MTQTWDDAAEAIATILFQPPTLRELYDRGAWVELARLANEKLTELGDEMSAPELAKFLAGKQHDYGTENINKFGIDGLKVRIWDKVAREENLVRRDASSRTRNESLSDTYTDLIGYVVILLMLGGTAADGRPLFELPLAIDVVAESTDADVEVAFNEAGAAEVKGLLERWNEATGPYSTEDWQYA